MAKFCTTCGNELPDGANNCPNCGAVVGTTPNNTVNNVQPGVEQKSKLVAGLLQIFLGGLGIGRFYLGYVGIGIAQILVSCFTCGIGAIWPLIDGIMILTGSVDKDANGIPLKD